jgi:hypothetical protein
MRHTLAMLCLAPLLAAGGPKPEIAVITEPACNGEPIVVTGEGFVPGQTVVKALCLGAYDAKQPDDPLRHLDALDHPPALPALPPANALDCKILGGGEGFLQVEFRSVAQSWVRAPFASAVWVGDGTTWSTPYLVNRPQAQWLAPQTQAPGEPIRVFGRTFAWDYYLPAALAVIRRAGTTNAIALRPASQHHEDEHTERWSLSAWLPPDLAPGAYELFVHGRHGGDYGWSAPLPLQVAAKPAAARRVVNVRELGAKGDGLTDDTAALEAALKQAAPGGTVLLPPGTYALTHTLEIPEDVVLQGAALHQTVLANLQVPSAEPWTLTEARTAFAGRDLLHGMRRFTLRDLTLRFMPAHGSALRVGKDPEWSEDVALYRVRLETQQDFSLTEHPYAARPLNIVKARRFSMVRCETYGPGSVSCERKVEDSLFAQNQFQADRRWRGHNFKFWGAEHCIFEDNRMSGDTRGLVMQTHFGVNYQNFIAGNTVERTVLGGNAGETYLVEGSGYLYESRVASADGAALRTERWPDLRGRAATATDCIGRFVVIARGRGLGQWRRISGCEPATRELRVAAPWRVTPDATSVVVVMNGLIETVFVNNQEIDCGKGLYLYGAGAINSVVDRHLCDRTLGVTLMTHDERQQANPAERVTAPDFFNLVIGCRVHDGGGILCSAGGRLPLEDERDAPLANFANRFVENEVQNVVPFSGAQYGANWAWGGGWNNLLAGLNVIPMDLGKAAGGGAEGPARMTGNVFCNNWVSGARVGVGVSKRAAHTLLLRTALFDVAEPLVDRGQATANLDPSIRKDDTYTPERGPIR